jgi:hypothetical protein
MRQANGFSVQGAGIKTVAGNRRIIEPDPRMYGMSNYDDVPAGTLEKGCLIGCSVSWFF